MEMDIRTTWDPSAFSLLCMWVLFKVKNWIGGTDLLCSIELLASSGQYLVGPTIQQNVFSVVLPPLLVTQEGFSNPLHLWQLLFRAMGHLQACLTASDTARTQVEHSGFPGGYYPVVKH